MILKNDFIQGQDKISFQISELLYNVCVMFSWIASEGRFWFKLSKVPVWEIVNTTFFFYKLHVHSSYIWASLGDGSQTFVAFILLMTDLCCTRMFDTVCFALTGRYPLLHITKSMYRGAAHTTAVTKLRTPEVPVATFLIISSRAKLTLYGVAMVTC